MISGDRESYFSMLYKENPAEVVSHIGLKENLDSMSSILLTVIIIVPFLDSTSDLDSRNNQEFDLM